MARCPHCDGVLRRAPATDVAGGWTWVCTKCDRPGTSVSGPTPDIPPELHRKFAIQHVEEMARQQRVESPALGDPRRWPALLGLPVELRAEPGMARPYATWATALFITVVSVFGFFYPEAVRGLAFVPADISRGSGIGIVTSFLVHGGWLHLFGNIWFLVVFGDEVEDYLGWRDWVLLVVFATISGSLLHWAGHVGDLRPVVGASAGISGLLAFYALRFPFAQLGTFVGVECSLFARWTTFDARMGFVVWLVLQFALYGYELSTGMGSVAVLGHLGGVAVGVAFWAGTRDREWLD